MPTKLALPLLFVLQDESGRYVMTNTSVSDPNQDLYYSYEYDTYGNIRSAEAHGSYHISDDYTNDYEYNNPKWLDLLTGFNDELIIYEGQSIVNGEIVGDPTSGNPISYFNGTRWEFTWQNGRQLASASTTDGDTTIDIDYTYDINGLRTSKTITRTTGSGTAHTHEYTSAVTAPTCTTAGYTTYTCDCGESYVDNLVDALGHNYVQSGNVYTCSRCGDSYTGHEHSYTETTTEPTCLTAGYTVYTCSCGDSYTVDIPALGHNYVLVNQTGNVATYECSRCGHRYTAVIPIDPNPPVEYGLRNGNVTITTEHHEYIYASGKLLQEVITTTDEDGNVTTETLDFTYDASGSPYTLTRTVGTTSITYYYVVNLQGDVIRLVSANGATVAEYAYDPYGRVILATGTMAEVNPLRYRGYYYDAESALFYVTNRYYDPEIGRWISPEPNIYYGRFDEGARLLRYNIYAYCANSPVSNIDPDGEAVSNIVGGIIGGVAGATLGYLLADALGLSGWKKAALIAAATAGGAVLGAFLGPYIAKLGSSLATKIGIKTAAKAAYKSIGGISKFRMQTHINVAKHLWSKVLKNATDRAVERLIKQAIKNGVWEPVKDGIYKITYKYAGEIITVTGRVINDVFNISDAWVNR